MSNRSAALSQYRRQIHLLIYDHVLTRELWFGVGVTPQWTKAKHCQVIIHPLTSNHSSVDVNIAKANVCKSNVHIYSASNGLTTIRYKYPLWPDYLHSNSVCKYEILGKKDTPALVYKRYGRVWDIAQ